MLTYTAYDTTRLGFFWMVLFVVRRCLVILKSVPTVIDRAELGSSPCVAEKVCVDI